MGVGEKCFIFFLFILTEHLSPVLVMGAGGLRESLVTSVVWEMDTKNGSGGDVVVSAVRERDPCLNDL